MQNDLFGNEYKPDLLLRDRFIEPPFTVLDARSGKWQARKRGWIARGIKSECGRGDHLNGFSDISAKGYAKAFNGRKWMEEKGMQKPGEGMSDTSIFDPCLCELIYTWFCVPNGKILDPFAGGSVRGIIANYMGYDYTGIELRQEQVAANIIQGKEILGDNCPDWVCGDSENILDSCLAFEYDLVFSCPPYFDLELYSDDPADLSNMDYPSFLKKYSSIIRKSCDKLKLGGYACFVVGEVRDKEGNYVALVPNTINAFRNAGMKFYNDAILINAIGSASIRAGKQMEASRKLVKVHQNVLIFKKCI